MAFTTTVATRFLKASRENRFFSWMSTLSIVGIGIGIATMIVVLSVIDGFETELRERFLAANAHILAFRFPNGLEKQTLWTKNIYTNFKEDISGISPFVHSDTMARKDNIAHDILIKGIIPKQRQNVQKIRGIIRPQKALKILQKEIEDFKIINKDFIPSIILGKGLLNNMNAKLGDTIELVSPSVDNNSEKLGSMIKFKVVGIYDSGLQHYDNKLGILSLSSAQQLFNMGKVVTGLEIGLKKPNDSIHIARKMRAKYSLSIKEWQSYNHHIFEAMRKERNLIAFIVALVAFVGSFNILSTLFVFVSLKQKEISLFKSLGANNFKILSIFLKQSTLMGIIGSFLGIILALIISFILSYFPFINLPDIYLLAHLPVKFDPLVYTQVVIGGIIVCSFAGLYPAWVATKVNPTQGLTLGREG